MRSKQQDVAKRNMFSVLFMTVDGEPMSFYLRPGPVKRKLQPLITAGGGLLCNVQQPGAILLIDPEERGSIPETTAHWYVSTRYIHDCIEKEEQLDLEAYRLNPETVQRQSAILSNRNEHSSGLLGGRVAYTPEEDTAILSYVSKHKTEIGGNRLWQQMEKQRVTAHSWQSMKYHYRVQLARKQSEVKGVETTEEEVKAAAEEEAKIDTEFTPAERTQPENLEAQTSTSLQQEVQHVNPQTDEQPAESTQVETVEAETSNSPQPEEPPVDPQIEAILESTEPKTDASQTTISPPKKIVPEDSEPAQPELLPSTSSQKKKASPKLVRPQRQSVRRQLELKETSSQPCSKKLRSAPTPVEQLSSSPRPSKKTKSAVKSASQKDTTVDQPPPKRAREKSETTVSQEEESVQATVSVQADESDSVPQTGEKKKEKRKLGILELATKEFEDGSEPEDEDPHLQNQTETTSLQPTSTDPLLPSSDTALNAPPTQSNRESGPNLQGNVQEVQASSSNHLPETSCPQPATSEPAAADVVQATSKAHLFIFDSESQDEDSQPIVGDSTAAKPQLTVNKEAALSLSQVQLEEDKQRIRELISQTNQDLICVTKALLRTSGDFSAALDLLLNPSSISGPFWNCCDDSLLQSTDPAVRQQLQEKYGEEGMAKRIVFLEIEGRK
ncbi:hypothetical protein PAMP_017573 [Pampus punctatissimus]